MGLPALADSGREVLEALLEHVRRLCKTRRKRVSGRPRRAEGVLAEGAPPAPALGGLGPVAWGLLVRGSSPLWYTLPLAAAFPGRVRAASLSVGLVTKVRAESCDLPWSTGAESVHAKRKPRSSTSGTAHMLWIAA